MGPAMLTVYMFIIGIVLWNEAGWWGIGAFLAVHVFGYAGFVFLTKGKTPCACHPTNGRLCVHGRKKDA